MTAQETPAGLNACIVAGMSNVRATSSAINDNS